MCALPQRKQGCSDQTIIVIVLPELTGHTEITTLATDDAPIAEKVIEEWAT